MKELKTNELEQVVGGCYHLAPFGIEWSDFCPRPEPMSDPVNPNPVIFS